LALKNIFVNIVPFNQLLVITQTFPNIFWLATD